MRELFEYFDPDKDSYEYTIKIALESDVDANDLQESLELALRKYDIVALEHIDTTPIQRTIEAFPNYRNIRAAIFRVATEYPMSFHQVINAVADDLGVANGQVLVKKDYDPNIDNADSLLYDEEEKGEDLDALLADPDYNEVEDIDSEEYHGNEYSEKNDEEIKEGSEERRASVRVWQSDLIPSEQSLDREKDEGLQRNHKTSNLSPMSSVYLNSEKEYANEDGQLSPLLRESIARLKIPASEKALLKKLILENRKKKERVNEVTKLKTKPGAVRHFASLLRQYDKVNFKMQNYHTEGNDKLKKRYSDKLDKIVKKINKHYGHLEDADGNKLKDQNIGHYDHSDPVGMAKSFLENN